MTPRRLLATLLTVLLVCGLLFVLVRAHERASARPAGGDVAGMAMPVVEDAPPAGGVDAETAVFAHNLRLRRGPAFRIYIPWIRGRMVRSSGSAVPSFDRPESFVFEVEKGVIRANLGDIGNFLNAAAGPDFPLRQIVVRGEGSQMVLTGTVHKLLLRLPIELRGTLAPGRNGSVHVHVTKISLLKVPMRLMLRLVQLTLADVMGSQPIAGLRILGDDLEFEPNLLPPPHLRGDLTSVTIKRPDLVLIFGGAGNDVQQEAKWHNFLRLTGGTLGFGHLVMQPADLTLVDASDETWFDLDLVHYQAQLTKGVERITADDGLEVFMPSLSESSQPVAPAISVDWLRDRSQPMPRVMAPK